MKSTKTVGYRISTTYGLLDRKEYAERGLLAILCVVLVLRYFLAQRNVVTIDYRDRFTVCLSVCMWMWRAWTVYYGRLSRIYLHHLVGHGPGSLAKISRGSIGLMSIRILRAFGYILLPWIFFVTISQTVQELLRWQTKKNRHTHPQTDTTENSTTFVALSLRGW